MTAIVLCAAVCVLGAAEASAGDPEGQITLFRSMIADPQDITVGPDGNLWFTNWGSNSIGRVTPAGVVSIFTDPGIDGPFRIAAGPDGNVWFTNSAGNGIGRVTPAGVVSIFTDPGI
ncbi:Vgb family protein, partial [Rhabdothermincola sp.]|uniref:Vgb family protein n=1 Tax=Rhabdothermincola sp. TaxID=2820405 RepID=UPI003FA69F12